MSNIEHNEYDMQDYIVSISSNIIKRNSLTINNNNISYIYETVKKSEIILTNPETIYNDKNLTYKTLGDNNVTSPENRNNENILVNNNEVDTYVPFNNNI